MSGADKKIVVFGAGSIGRGFLGQIFGRSGWEVTFVDADEGLVEALRERGEYSVNLLSPDGGRETVAVESVDAVSAADGDAVRERLEGCRYVGISVGGRILPMIAGTLSELLGPSALADRDIILAENIHDPQEAFARHLSPLNAEDPADPSGLPGVHLCAVGKMVPVSTAEEGRIDLDTEAMNELIIDGTGWKNPIPAVPWLTPVDSIEAYIDRKLFVHNLSHAAFAFLSHPFGRKYRYVSELMDIDSLKAKVGSMMDGVLKALEAEYPGEFTYGDLKEHLDDLFVRFGNPSLKDTIDRVGRDVARKLGNEDRVVGALSLCLKHGLPIADLAEVYLAGLHFAAIRGEEVGGSVPAIREGSVEELRDIVDEINGPGLDPAIRWALLEANSRS